MPGMLQHLKDTTHSYPCFQGSISHTVCGTRMSEESDNEGVKQWECAYYDAINDAPDDANKATLVKNAMEAIEKENPKMEGVLPKEVYAQLVPEEEPELLSRIVRVFKDISENCTVDIFGEIYEYFLGNFALAEGKDGGTFYTPATVVTSKKVADIKVKADTLGNVIVPIGLRYCFS